jgi:hypothetical protein
MARFCAEQPISQSHLSREFIAALRHAWGRWLYVSSVLVGLPFSWLRGQASEWKALGAGRLNTGLAHPEFRDIAVGPTGDVFLLDGTGRNIVILQRTNATFRLGPILRIPGIVYPAAIAFDDSRNLVVLDARLGTVSRFHVDKAVLRLVSELPTVEGASNLCIMGNSTVVLAATPGHLLEVMNYRGTVTARVGRRFADDSLPDIAAGSASSGPLLCDEGLKIIVVASSLLGEVRAYSLGGDLLWRHVLAGYNSPSITVSNDLSLARMKAHPGGTHSVLSLVDGQHGQLLVQMGLTKPVENAMIRLDGLETREVDLRTGRSTGTAEAALAPFVRHRGNEYYGVSFEGGVVDVAVYTPAVKPRRPM